MDIVILFLLVKVHDSYNSHESYDFMYSLHSEDAPVKTSQKGTKGKYGKGKLYKIGYIANLFLLEA